MTKDRDDDIRETMKDEGSRGTRRPNSPEAAREHAKRVRQMRKLLEKATEEEVITAIRAAGLRDGSPEAARALQIWRENRS
jgi:hypothetical protein